METSERSLQCLQFVKLECSLAASDESCKAIMRQCPSDSSGVSSLASSLCSDGPDDLPDPAAEVAQPDVTVKYGGRDVLDLADNLQGGAWNLQYAHLPERNVTMFMDNRSQYHRLSTYGAQVFQIQALCRSCDFLYGLPRVR